MPLSLGARAFVVFVVLKQPSRYRSATTARDFSIRIEALSVLSSVCMPPQHAISHRIHDTPFHQGVHPRQFMQGDTSDEEWSNTLCSFTVLMPCLSPVERSSCMYVSVCLCDSLPPRSHPVPYIFPWDVASSNGKSLGLCSWLLLAALGCSCVLLAAPGCSWPLLAARG